MTTATAPTQRADAPEVLEAIRQETAAAVRNGILQAFAVDDPMPEQVTIAPSSIEAIEASLGQDIYNARRLARLRMLGLEPVPEPSAEAFELLRRSKAAAEPAR